ncbi:hypothetical protein [Halococcoides cellulosivorans]|uniref:Uncharacterized protein n=1 Tax=Halococcoides cellulosivorans TaxID=1679096 RepID=A0A2R4X1X2_9EURY|nr:hypothetical protein [Halococcoides cellulosivorans]AWB27802.1 hypothetical protein HARCEL1_08805 [Halococcoides cellulosivorans]
MPNHPVPKASLDTLQEIIEGYYEAADTDELVEDEDVEEEIESSSDVIRRQKKFFADVGLLSKEGHDYRLLQAGNNIGRALAFDREGEAAEGLRDLLDEWEVTEELINDIGSGELVKDEVIDSLAFITETDPSTPRKKTGLAALVDLFVWTGILIETEGGNYRIADTQRQSDSVETKQTEEIADEKEERQDQSPESEPSVDGQEEEVRVYPQEEPSASKILKEGQFSINLDLSGDEGPENVKKLIIAVREGLEAEVPEPQTPSENGESEGHRTLTSYEDR